MATGNPYEIYPGVQVDRARLRAVLKVLNAAAHLKLNQLMRNWASQEAEGAGDNLARTIEGDLINAVEVEARSAQLIDNRTVGLTVGDETVVVFDSSQLRTMFDEDNGDLVFMARMACGAELLDLQELAYVRHVSEMVLKTGVKELNIIVDTQIVDLMATNDTEGD